MVQRHAWPHAVFQFADLADCCLALADDVCWSQGCVDYADVCGGGRGGAWGTGQGGRRRCGRTVRLAGQVQRDMLFRYQACSDAGTQVFVQKPSHLRPGNVLAAFEESLGQDGDGVRMRLHQVRHHLGELPFVIQCRDGLFLPWQQRRQGVHVVVVDARYVRVRDHDEGKVA